MPLGLSVRSRPGAWLLIQASGLLAEQRAAALSPRLRVSPPGLVTKTLPRPGWSSPGLPSPAISRRQTTPPALCAGLSHASRLVPETRRMVHGQKRAGQLRAGRAPQALPQGSSGIRQHLCLEPSPPPSPPRTAFFSVSRPALGRTPRVPPASPASIAALQPPTDSVPATPPRASCFLGNRHSPRHKPRTGARPRGQAQIPRQGNPAAETRAGSGVELGPWGEVVGPHGDVHCVYRPGPE